MYLRCFDAMVPVFLYMNRYPIGTKFALVAHEVIMNTQATTVVMELGVRLTTICLPSADITKVVDHSPKWILLTAQVPLPLIVATPLYCIFDFQYRLEGADAPVLLTAYDVSYDAVSNNFLRTEQMG
ncbi:unnamed protein product [Haemonchus placei]|uniref:Tudor domain-containing protein n=1 Tax=Haemonchus placei TaxID=6290 RepID=A0A0N4X1R0_HAEPC|nr:unnamed protein product [Haemonchus placei]